VFADGRPLLNAVYNHAQPIDAHLYKDDDGSVYLYYGGWRHMMVCKMREDMMGFETIPAPAYDGIAREVTPLDYVEAPYVMKLNGKYHLMYSTGKWGDGTYCVKAAVSQEPMGEFVYYRDILRASDLADGPGHNSAFFFEGKWYVAYHRRTIGDGNKHHRKLCIDLLSTENGELHPVLMT
jgi:beta-xylosidase